MSVFFIIIIITATISITAFYRPHIMNMLDLKTYKAYHNNEIHRLLTCGFVHADWNHLIFNMVSFFFFGRMVEYRLGGTMFLVMYLSAIVFSNITTLIKHKDNHGYSAVGASGGVSAVIFSGILYEPLMKVFVPFPIPGILYALIFLGYSYYMTKKQSDNINHDAHFMGAIYGLAFPILINPHIINVFFYKIFSVFN